MAQLASTNNPEVTSTTGNSSKDCIFCDGDEPRELTTSLNSFNAVDVIFVNVSCNGT